MIDAIGSLRRFVDRRHIVPIVLQQIQAVVRGPEIVRKVAHVPRKVLPLGPQEHTSRDHVVPPRAVLLVAASVVIEFRPGFRGVDQTEQVSFGVLEFRRGGKVRVGVGHDALLVDFVKIIQDLAGQDVQPIVLHPHVSGGVQTVWLEALGINHIGARPDHCTAHERAEVSKSEIMHIVCTTIN